MTVDDDTDETPSLESRLVAGAVSTDEARSAKNKRADLAMNIVASGPTIQRAVQTIRRLFIHGIYIETDGHEVLHMHTARAHTDSILA